MLDYELRMVQKGYLPMISHRSLAFCNCVNQQKADFECMLGKCDRDILKEKWHMNYFNLIPANNIVDFIKEQKEARVRILEVGCDLGDMLFYIFRYFHQLPYQLFVVFIKHNRSCFHLFNII